MSDLAKFKALLETTHTFPTVYLHKFIGKNSKEFKESVEELERKFVDLKRTDEKLSANQGHLALTYHFNAKDSQAILDLNIATHSLKDLLFIL